MSCATRHGVQASIKAASVACASSGFTVPISLTALVFRHCCFIFSSPRATTPVMVCCPCYICTMSIKLTSNTFYRPARLQTRPSCLAQTHRLLRSLLRSQWQRKRCRLQVPSMRATQKVFQQTRMASVLGQLAYVGVVASPGSVSLRLI